MGHTLLVVLAQAAHRKNEALIRGGWNFTNRRCMIRNWERYV